MRKSPITLNLFSQLPTTALFFKVSNRLFMLAYVKAEYIRVLKDQTHINRLHIPNLLTELLERDVILSERHGIVECYWNSNLYPCSCTFPKRREINSFYSAKIKRDRHRRWLSLLYSVNSWHKRIVHWGGPPPEPFPIPPQVSTESPRGSKGHPFNSFTLITSLNYGYYALYFSVICGKTGDSW
jgi:hypothetical protein